MLNLTDNTYTRTSPGGSYPILLLDAPPPLSSYSLSLTLLFLFAMADNLPPVVIVGGFLARNSQSYWGDVEQFFSAEDNRRKVIIAPYVFYLFYHLISSRSH